MCVLETKCQSSARAVNTLNGWAASPPTVRLLCEPLDLVLLNSRNNWGLDGFRTDLIVGTVQLSAKLLLRARKHSSFQMVSEHFDFCRCCRPQLERGLLECGFV